MIHRRTGIVRTIQYIRERIVGEPASLSRPQIFSPTVSVDKKHSVSVTMNISPSVLVTLALLASSGVCVSLKIRTMMWKSLSCTLLRFFSSEKNYQKVFTEEE